MPPRAGTLSCLVLTWLETYWWSLGRTLWVCSDHQCSGEEEEDKASLAANLAQVVYSQLDCEQGTAIIPMGNGWEFAM